MGKLDSLKITECPYAFASFAAKHNALCDLMAGMVGENGISVVMAEKNAIIRANIAGGSLGNVTGTMANVVGSDGRLQNVYAGTAIANAYPTELRVLNTGVTTKTNAAGVSVESSASDIFLDSANSKVEINFGGGELIRMFYGGGGPDLLIQGTTRSLQVKEIDVCSANVAMKMLVIASDPY